MDTSGNHSVCEVEEPHHPPPLTKSQNDNGNKDIIREGCSKRDTLLAAGLFTGTGNTLEVCMSYSIKHILLCGSQHKLFLQHFWH